MNKLKLAIVSFGFLGTSPFAPGTVGTIGGVLLAFLLARTENFLLWSILTCVVIYAVGRALGDWAESYAGKKDPGIFVLDEGQIVEEGNHAELLERGGVYASLYAAHRARLDPEREVGRA